MAILYISITGFFNMFKTYLGFDVGELITDIENMFSNQ
jgi:hypothetical protein